MADDSRAVQAAIAGVVGLVTMPLALFATPFLLLSAGASIYAIYVGFQEFKRVGTGELADDQKLPALAAMGLGGMGCLSNLAVFVTVFLAVSAIVLSILVNG